MAIKFVNNFGTTLASNITSVQTSITVSSGTGSGFPTLGGGDVCYATLISPGTQGPFEVVRITAVVSDTLTVVRAQDSTTARAWLQGDAIEVRLPRVVLDSFAQTNGVALGTMAFQNANAVAITGGTITGTSLNAGTVNNSTINYIGTVGGTSAAITLTPSPALSAYVAGQTFTFLAPGSSVLGAATVNISGLGTKALLKRASTGLVNLAIGDFSSSVLITIRYDGTRFLLDQVGKYMAGSNAASAASLSLVAFEGDYITVTGTTGITSITLGVGDEKTLLFAGALTLTNSASLILPSGANITTAAGDTCVVRGEASSVVRVVSYTRANGTAVVVASQLVSGTPVTLPAATSQDFTSIPAGVKTVKIMLSGVSWNNSVIPIFQIGSGSIVATGYLGSATRIAPTTTVANYTTGFGITGLSINAVDVVHGMIELNLLNASTNKWVATGNFSISNTNDAYICAGSIALSGALDRIRLTTTVGTGTFDAGEMNIQYE